MYDDGEGVRRNTPRRQSGTGRRPIRATDAQYPWQYVLSGNGVPQDYVLAHMWTNLGISRMPSAETKKREHAIRMRDAALQY